jgi:hypothetical protein
MGEDGISPPANLMARWRRFAAEKATLVSRRKLPRSP